MRVGIGQIADAPITLISGKVIANPSVQAPTGNDCLPYQCGADSSNIAALMWCSSYGQAAAFPCSDSECDPVRSMLNCSGPATSAPAQAPIKGIPALSPQNIVQPLPDVTATLAPVPECPHSLWCNLNQAIAQNPIIAIAALAGAAFLLWPKGAR